MLFENWTIVPNYEKVDAPVSVRGGAIRADLKEGQYSLARVVGRTDGYRGKADYRMTFSSRCDRGVKRQVFYNWLDADGKTLFMGHGAPEIEFTSPDGAAALEITVCFLGYDGGHGELSDLKVEYLREHAEHHVRLAACMITHGGAYTPESNLAISLKRIDAAAAAGADLALLTETYNSRHVANLQDPFDASSTMDDVYVTALRDKAKEHRMFVAASVKLAEDGYVSNTCLIFGRDGNLVGRYTKTHHTMSEIWGGRLPGNDIPVFDTELGKIGVSICWDLFFPEHARVMFMKGVDIILNPTAGKCPFEHGASGYCNGAFILTANTSADPSLTRVTDRHGETVAEADPEKGFVIADVDVNAYEPHYWLSAPDSYTDPRFVFMGERRPDLYGILSETENTGYDF